MQAFILTYKLGRKLTGIAGIEMPDDACLNDAVKYFISQGYPNPRHHKDYNITCGSVETQKNYCGRSPLFKMV